MNIFSKILPPPDKFLGFIAGITASIFWGFHPVLIRYLILEDVSPFAITTLRLLIGSGSLTVMYVIARLFSKRKFPIIFRYGKFFWFAVIGLAVNFPLFHFGLKYTIASDAILLESFAPVVVMLLVLCFAPSTFGNVMNFPKLLRNIFLLVVAGAVGSSLLIVNQPHILASSPQLKVTGDIIEFIAMVFFATYLFSAHQYQQTNLHESPIKVTAHFLFFTALLTAPFVPWTTILTFTPTQWIWIFVLGFCSTAINYLLWQTAAKALDVIPLALLFSLSSIFNVAIESLIFNLNLSATLILGAVFILSSSIATQYFMSKYKLSSSSDDEKLQK